MIMEITKQQIRLIFKHLPNEAKMDKGFRASLVAQFSSESKISLTDLTADEADVMIAKLSGTYSHYALFESDKTQHRQILSLCYQLGWVRYDKRKSRDVPCIETLGKWIANRTEHKRPLMRLGVKDTQKVIYQLDKMVG